MCDQFVHLPFHFSPVCIKFSSMPALCICNTLPLALYPVAHARTCVARALCICGILSLAPALSHPMCLRGLASSNLMCVHLHPVPCFQFPSIPHSILYLVLASSSPTSIPLHLYSSRHVPPQTCIKISNEPPSDMRSNMRRALSAFTPEMCDRPTTEVGA